AVLFLAKYRTAVSEKKSSSWIALGGIFLGLAVVIRELIVLLVVFLFFWIMKWGRDYDHNRTLFHFRDFLIMIACMAMLILPITVKNYLNTGRFYLVYRSGGDSWSLASRWGEDNDPSNKELIRLGIDPFKDIKGSIRSIIGKPIEVTVAVSKLIPLRIRNFFLWPKFGFFDPVYMFNPYRIPNDYGSVMMFYYIILLIASFALFAVCKADAGLKFLVSLPIIYYCIFHGVFFLSRSTRYAAPMTPFLSIVIAYGITHIFRIVLYGKS
ncbi:MAG: hypothetical protein NC933_04910, partial [Candidatus Omnitrophica bacterium]|nr:hypothetical protein [Candidatus Omnitrophota bacterium]